MTLLLINEVVDSFFGLQLKLLGIRYTPYCAHTGTIPIKIHFSMTFSSRVSRLTDSDMIKSARVRVKIRVGRETGNKGIFYLASVNDDLYFSHTACTELKLTFSNSQTFASGLI